MYDRILVPTDGSDGASRALAHALDVAGRTGASIDAVYVVDTGAVVDGATTGLLDRLAAEGDRAVETVADRTAAAGVELAGTAVVEGRPAARIVDYAAARGADLIVLGTHGRTGVDRYLLGSVAERVVRRAGVPVLVVPIPADETDADADAASGRERGTD